MEKTMVLFAIDSSCLASPWFLSFFPLPSGTLLLERPPLPFVASFLTHLTKEKARGSFYTTFFFGAQPPTVLCKMEAQSEYVHIAYMFLHVLVPICMLSG